MILKASPPTPPLQSVRGVGGEAFKNLNKNSILSSPIIVAL